MDGAIWKGLAAIVLAAAAAVVGPRAASAQMPASETFEPQAVGVTSVWSVATTDVPAHLMPSLELVAHFGRLAAPAADRRRLAGLGRPARRAPGR